MENGHSPWRVQTGGVDWAGEARHALLIMGALNWSTQAYLEQRVAQAREGFQQG